MNRARPPTLGIPVPLRPPRPTTTTMRLATAALLTGLGLAACQLAGPLPEPHPPSPVVPPERARVFEGPLGRVEWTPDLAAWRALQEGLEDGVEEEAEAGSVLYAVGGGSAGGTYGGRTSTPASPGGPGAQATDAPPSGGGGGYYRGPGDTRMARPATPGKASEAESVDTTTWQRAAAAANAVRLFVGDEDRLPLDGVEARVWVDGPRARVLLDCAFTNDRDRQLEGTFKLRLPEGASPYYLAFGEDVVADGADWHADLGDRASWQGPEPEAVLASREGRWQGAREARMVPRGQAARAYKAEVRRSVDPALLEWAGAGVFQARVFPLLPKQRHRVVIGYELDLVAVPDTDAAYELDLAFPADLPGLGLEVSVLAPNGVVPELLEPADAGETWLAGERQVMAWPATDARAFRLRIDHDKAGGLAIASGLDGGYLAMDVPVDLGTATLERAGSPTAVFLVDTSLSAADDLALRLELLEAILDGNRGRLQEFAVLLFDVTPRWWRDGPVPNTRFEVERLLADLSGLALEGATDLGAALAEASTPTWGRIDGADLFLLSDGAATWGTADRRRILAGHRAGGAGPVFAYTTGAAGTDRAALEFLTAETGGAVFALAGPADLERAATAHRGAPWTLGDLRLPGCRDLLLRGMPTAAYPGQRLRLVGRGVPRDGDVLEVDLRRDGAVRTLRLPLARVLTSPLAARAYGVVATPELEPFGRATRAAAEAFATHFRVPGKAASLLMLEDEAAYARQGVLQDADLDLARNAAVTGLVADALAGAALLLDDPAMALLELLEPLAESGGLGALPEPRLVGTRDEPASQGPGPAPVATLVLPADFCAALAALPPEALVVGPDETAPLPLASTWAEDVPAELREALASGEPAYDLVQDHAARRLATLGLGDAVRLLACLVELNPGDHVFARDVAQTLTAWGLHGHAYHLLVRVAEARPFEPQSYLSLARAAEELGKGDLALFWYTVTLSGQWEGRFGDVHQIAAFDAMHFLRKAVRGEVEVLGRGWLETGMPGLAEAVTPISLSEELELAVAIQWNTDGTDIDLHVLDPAGEHCYYGHRGTAAGGHLSRDVTQGYGPELFTLPYVDEGETLVWARFFASNPNRTSVRTKVLATLYQNWGAEDETVERRVIELTEAEQEHGLLKLTVR